MLDLVALSRALTPPANYRPAARFDRLFPYQQAAVAQIPLRKHPMLAHAPGAGKTPIALAALNMRERVLIVCPPTITRQWERRMAEWCGIPIDVVTTGAMARNLRPTQSAIVADSLVHHIPPGSKFDTLVIDEVHRMKSTTSRRSAAVFGSDRDSGLAHYAGRVMSLTGTPLQNSPVDLYPLLSVCAPEIAPSFKEYTERYCPPVEQRIARVPFPIKRYDLNMQNLEELAVKLRGSLMIRPSAAECLAQLPPLIEDEYHLEGIVDPAKDVVSADELADIFDGAHASPVDKERSASLRRETGLAKVQSDQFISWVRDLIESGERPILVGWHQDVINHIAAKLSCGRIHGGIDMSARAGWIADFAAGRSKALALTMGAAGTGIDGLQQSGSLMILIEESYVPSDNEQAIGRLHRTGQTRGVRIIRVRTSTVNDRAVQLVLKRKIAMISKVMQ